MLKALMKKQLMELNQSLFVNMKSGERKPRAKVILSITMFAVLMIVVIGGIFWQMAESMSPLIKAGAGWLYMLIMAAVSVALGTFGSVFNTYASLYKAKDNDLLLSMPVPAGYLLLVRLTGVYFMSVLYSMVVYIPGLIVYFSTAQRTPAVIICGILFGILLTLIVLILSCLLGWGVARISSKLKNKSAVMVVASLAFLGLYYFIYFKASQMLETLLGNILVAGDAVKNKAYVLYQFGLGAAGEAVPMAVTTLVVLVALAAVVFVMKRSFVQIATQAEQVTKKVYKEKIVAKRSLRRALLWKECKHFTSSATYMLNCAMGTLMLPVAGVAAIVKAPLLLQLQKEIFGEYVGTLVLMLIGAIALMTSMNDITAPAISLEGKNIWLSQSLPVKPWQVLRSKLELHMWLTGVPAVFCSICVVCVLPVTLRQGIWLVLWPLLYVLFGALLGLMVNLKRPNLKWTNETAAVKQNFGVVAVIFGNWIVLGVLAAGYLNLPFTAEEYMTVSFAVLLAVCAGMLHWVRIKGSRIFASL